MTETQKAWVRRVLIGGGIGMAVGFFGVGFLLSPGLLLGAGFSEFVLYIGYSLPEWLGSFLALILWFLFGAEIAIATLPFADEGGRLLCQSLCHFAAMACTVGGYVWLNFGIREAPWFLVRLAAVYVLVWGVRWVFWYFELRSIRKKLGLGPRKKERSK